MKARRVLGWGVLAILLALAAAFIVAYLRSDNVCPDPAPSGERMKAIVYCDYGSADVLRFQDIPKPTPAEDEILVKVKAAGVNPLDSHYMRGTPYIMRMTTGLRKPAITRLGTDFAGTVESVGSRVTRFKPGDEVFGGRTGAFAEYLTVRQDRAVVLKPANVDFDQAGAVAIAAITALQGLRDKGRVQPGQKVLINGASGGVGTFAVQIAKAFGADVTGVCSTRNVELVRSLGADHVIDYTRENFTEGDQQYDLILDMVGNHPLLALRRVMTPKGTMVIVGGPKTGKLLGPMIQPLKAMFVSPFVEQDFSMLLAEFNQKDMEFLRELMASGQVTPVIDRRYSLSEVPEAIRYLEQGHARGKVVIAVDGGGTELPAWTFNPAMIFPADRSLARPEDGVVLADGRLIVADQVHGLRLIDDDGSSRPFGKFAEAGYRHDPPEIVSGANGVTLEPAGTHILVSDIFRGDIYRVDIATEATERVYQHTFGINMARGDRSGGIWFTQSTQNRPEEGPPGIFRAIDQPIPDGALFYLPPRTADDEPEAVQKADGLVFANGLALDEAGGYLYLAETMGNRVSRYRLDATTGRVSDPTVLLEVAGPDNIELDRHNRLWIAATRRSEILVLDPATQVARSVFRISTPQSERLIEQIESRLQEGAPVRELLTPELFQPAPGPVTGMIISPDDGSIYLTGLGDALIRLER